MAGIETEPSLARSKDVKERQEERVGGIVFIRTQMLKELSVFYIQKVGCRMWLDQGSVHILKFGNMLFGLHEAEQADLDSLLTLFYETRSGVDRAHEKFKDSAGSPPRENPKYRIYHFFCLDPEGRRLEFQCFLHPVDWDFSPAR